MTRSLRPIRIGVASAHDVVLEFFPAGARLSPGIVVVGCYKTSEEALYRMRKDAFDILVVDQGRNQTNGGVDLIRLARRLDPAVGCILLTADNSRAARAAAKKAGASEVIWKPHCFRDLIPMVASIALGPRGIVPSDMAEDGAATRDQTPSVEYICFTEAECEAMRATNDGLPDKDAAELFGRKRGTHKALIEHAKQRAGVTTRAELLLIARRRGVI